jgi:hypothetical protein
MRRSGAATSSDTGASVTLKGAIHEVWDYGANTRTISGKVWGATTEAACSTTPD